MIAEKMKPFVQNNSAIRMMFEEGNRLRAKYGADKVYDFSLGNPSVPAPDCVREAIIDLVNNEEPTVLHGYMSNAGFEDEAAGLARHFEEVFAGYDYVVGPSASCVSFVRDHYGRLLPDHQCHSQQHVYEICEFVHDVIRPTSLNVSFPHKVSLQNSCHGVRLLGLSSPSERNVPYANKLRDLLGLVRDIEVVEPERRDECCGFGGMFAVEEHAVSGQMGRDKVMRHVATGAEYIVGADCSCLMHQNGIIAREGLNIKTLHIAQILSGNV